MANSDSRTQITVAVIGLFGVLATAVIANWGQIFPKHDAKPDSSQNTASDRTSSSNDGKSSKSTDGKPSTSMEENTLGDGPEGVMILSATPPNGSHLKQGQPTEFKVMARYRLTSLDKATLAMGLVQYPNATDCSGPSDGPASGEALVFRGEDTVAIPIQWTVGVSKEVTSKGSIGYAASFWSDVAGGKLFRSFRAIRGYCYSFD